MKQLLLFALLAGCWTGCAMADGNALLRDCQSALQFMEGAPVSNLIGAGECIGMIQATVDTLEISRHTFTSDKAKPLPPLICWPTAVVIPKAQNIRIVVKHLQRHPEDLHLNGSTLTILALAGAFPCTKPD